MSLAKGVYIVGMSGCVVQTGAGIKSLVIHDTESDRFYLAGNSQNQNTKGQMEYFRKEGLWMPISQPRPYVIGYKILYAGKDFLSKELWKLIDRSPLEWDDEAKAYIVVCDLPSAITKMETWAQTLLDWGISHLATDSAMVSEVMRRALYCASRENQALRLKVTSCLIMAYRRMGISNRADARIQCLYLDYPNDDMAEQVEHMIEELSTLVKE